MDFKITLVKAFKHFAFVLTGAILAGLLGSDVSASIADIANAIASAIPLVGGLVAPALKAVLIAGLAAIVAAIENVRKHLND